MHTSLKLTPMLRQYLEIKEQHPDAILMYRMGDFYEMFFDDAVLAAKELGITLTSRSHKEETNKIPMCGVPFHAVTGYLGKLIKAGHRVALCEQVEDPREAKGIVKREVVRVVSPGVTTDDQILDEKTDCYVCALAIGKKSKEELIAGLAFVDISTGRFQISEVVYPPGNPELVADEITLLKPAEILLSQSDTEQRQDLVDLFSAQVEQLCFTVRPDYHFDGVTARNTLTEHFRTTNLAGFGCETYTNGIRAAGALIQYLRETQKSDLSHIRQISPLHQDTYLIIDDASRRNLELTETLIGGRRAGSLLECLDLTVTSMGARLLRRWLLFPLRDPDAIQARLAAVEELLNKSETRKIFRTLLDSVYDIERLCSRLVLGHGNARDMSAVKLSLRELPALQHELGSCQAPLFKSLNVSFDPLIDLHALLDRAIRDDAPISLREGRLIKEGYHAELDHLITLLRDGKKLILALEQTEREKSGLAKLKVGYNKVFGYYFEVSRSQAEDVPDYFIRKQTLVNAERFITPELKELENDIATAQERRLELEYALFADIRTQFATHNQRLLTTAGQLATIDILASFAESAARHRYQRPAINTKGYIRITEGRHPVIEQTLEPGRFVPNDMHLDQQTSQLLIITGPNMAGKSTVLRQTALIALMAHVGCFVPADSADICIVDRIFTRVGAMDDLRRGQSTFMVEMNETANILNNATENSLVILDEIGRGTSTHDGLAIAWAVVEELAQKNTVGIKTLFATHYHEMTVLATNSKKICNYSIAVSEQEGTIRFLHKLVSGAADRSYGIQVASLAGVPPHVIARAQELLTAIEKKEGRSFRSIQSSLKKQGGADTPRQMSLFAYDAGPLVRLLSSIEPDEISPREALDILYRAQHLLKFKHEKM
ncbi:DNA mismatch repair protein MutS [Desulfobulbus alkaliphilus]|uniref:DNA mismatch repair protein MutS n=1 Tax=Desulfobulbus alkaliphilus TaxID=869814 RepID=UPI0019657831|nr:DNA mismatch repair protein MutS [Desulfobulbus alkaliphilus]MBM9537246.1 DNA mismatch repair protein MutS [Desulfobulbus alkaliphilus]